MRASKRGVGILLGLTVSLIVSPAAWADVVELKTGRRVEGKFKRANSTWVWIDADGREVVFKRDQIRAIYFGSAPAQSTQPADAFKALIEALGQKKQRQEEK